MCLSSTPASPPHPPLNCCCQAPVLCVINTTWASPGTDPKRTKAINTSTSIFLPHHDGTFHHLNCPHHWWMHQDLRGPELERVWQRAEFSKVHNLVFPNSPSKAAQKGQDTLIFLLLVCREHFTFSQCFIYPYLFILLLVTAGNWAVLRPLRSLKDEVASVGVSLWSHG